MSTQSLCGVAALVALPLSPLLSIHSIRLDTQRALPVAPCCVVCCAVLRSLEVLRNYSIWHGSTLPESQRDAAARARSEARARYLDWAGPGPDRPHTLFFAGNIHAQRGDNCEAARAQLVKYHEQRPGFVIHNTYVKTGVDDQIKRARAGR